MEAVDIFLSFSFCLFMFMGYFRTIFQEEAQWEQLKRTLFHIFLNLSTVLLTGVDSILYAF